MLASADRGYAVVVQDTRGTGGSSGMFMPSVNELEDACSTLDWLRGQPWYGSRVGVIGASYFGYTAWSAMATGDADIAAAVSLVTAGSPFHGDADRKNGCYSSTCMMWDIGMSLRERGETAGNADWEGAINTLPIGSIPERACGERAYIWDEYLNHPDYDDFWEAMDIAPYAGHINVPTLYLTGYHEGCIGGTIEMWGMNERSGRENQRLICGPWYHDFNGNRTLPGERLSADAILCNPDLIYERWFDRWLRGQESTAAALPRVSYYIEGANRWRQAESMTEGARRERLYFGADGSLSAAPAEAGCLSYDYDPADATPQVFEEDEYMIPADYSAVEERGDVLAFTTSPFAADTSIVGGCRAVLYISSTARDTDFVVRLTVAGADGSSRALASQIIRAKYRDSFSNPSLLEPGERYRLELELPWMARLIRAGDALRVEVCSAAKGDYFPNLNTGEDPATDAGVIVAKQTVYFGENEGSYIEVSLLDEEDER